MKTLNNQLAAVGLVLALPVLAAAETTAFVNVNVVPMTAETVLRGRTVIVDGSTIVSIGSAEGTAVPKQARVVDGTDRYLMPGLAEMHGHVPDASSGNLDRVLTLFLVNGVTTVRGMLGQPSHLELREAIERGEILAPRLFTSGPSFNGNSVDGVAMAARRVREQKAAGYDFLKIHPGLSKEEFASIARTANELKIPFAGHVPADVGVTAALAAGIASIDHLDGYMETLVPRNVDPSGGFGGFFGVLLASAAEPSRIEAMAAATAEAGVWNVPTESLFEHALSAIEPQEMMDWPEMQYMPAETVAQWHESSRALGADVARQPEAVARAIELRRRLILALHDAGAGLLLGSDSPQIFNVPGFAIHRELGYLVDAGLTPFEALLGGTAKPAEFFGHSKRFGTILPGLDADLVLLDDNPLEHIAGTRRIHGVMVRGRWLNRQLLDQMLAEIRRGR